MEAIEDPIVTLAAIASKLSADPMHEKGDILRAALVARHGERCGCPGIQAAWKADPDIEELSRLNHESDTLDGAACDIGWVIHELAPVTVAGLLAKIRVALGKAHPTLDEDDFFGMCAMRVLNDALLLLGDDGPPKAAA